MSAAIIGNARMVGLWGAEFTQQSGVRLSVRLSHHSAAVRDEHSSRGPLFLILHFSILSEARVAFARQRKHSEWK